MLNGLRCKFQTPLVLVWDSHCRFCQRWAERIHRWDWLKRVHLVDSENVHTVPADWLTGWTPEIAERSFWVRPISTRSKGYEGFYAIRRLAWALPILWLIIPVLYLPPVPWLGGRIYAWVAAHRHQLGCGETCRL